MLAQDDTPGISPLLHAIEQLPGFDWTAPLLQPTSPLRSATDIDGIFTLCGKYEAPSAVSVCSVDQHPYWMYERNDNLQLSALYSSSSMFSRRQNCWIYIS